MQIKPGMKVTIKCLDAYSRYDMRSEVGKQAVVLRRFCPDLFTDIFTVSIPYFNTTSEYKASSLISNIVNTKLGKILYK